MKGICRFELGQWAVGLKLGAKGRGNWPEIALVLPLLTVGVRLDQQGERRRLKATLTWLAFFWIAWVWLLPSTQRRVYRGYEIRRAATIFDSISQRFPNTTYFDEHGSVISTAEARRQRIAKAAHQFDTYWKTYGRKAPAVIARERRFEDGTYRADDFPARCRYIGVGDRYTLYFRDDDSEIWAEIESNRHEKNHRWCWKVYEDAATDGFVDAGEERLLARAVDRAYAAMLKEESHSCRKGPTALEAG